MNLHHFNSPRLFAGVFTGFAALFATPEALARTSVSIGINVGPPQGCYEVRAGGERCYYGRGVFYRPSPQGCQVIRAPRGAVVRELPRSYTRVCIGTSVYYRYDDVYYQSCHDGYVVVEAPVVIRQPAVVVRQTGPVIVTTSPARPDVSPVPPYQCVWLGDVEYRFRDGQFFRPTADGLVWCQPPYGAVARTLPSPVQSVWYQEVEFYQCEDVYFRKIPDGYRVVEAPWKGR